jgi:hypothetical protein
MSEGRKLLTMAENRDHQQQGQKMMISEPCTRAQELGYECVERDAQPTSCCRMLTANLFMVTLSFTITDMMCAQTRNQDGGRGEESNEAAHVVQRLRLGLQYARTSQWNRIAVPERTRTG